MKILIVEPMQHPRRADIPHTLEEMQRIVGGYIEEICPCNDDPVSIVCDEEGKLKDYELNRYIPAVDIIAGTFFICGLDAEGFTDLSEDMADKYEKLLYYPQAFVRTPKGILIISADRTRKVIM